MMNYRINTTVFFIVFAISPINGMNISVSQAAFLVFQETIEPFIPPVNKWEPGWHLGLEYTFGGNTKNPNGDFSISLGYQMRTNNHSSGLKDLSCNIQYENKPGLLGNWGHLQGKIDASHYEKTIDTCIKIAAIEVNTVLDYNPAIIARNERLIAQLKAQQKHAEQAEQEKLEKLRTKINEYNKINKNNFSLHKQTFFSHKAVFESQPFDENDPKAVEVKNMLKELEKIYGS